MNNKIVAVWVSMVMILSFIVIIIEIAQVVVAPPTTWYVDDVPGSSGPGDPPEDYTSIQDAINACSDGDTVFVYVGTYNERVIVNKTINLIGEDKDATEINEGGIENGIYVTSDWVNITGFSITNSGSVSGYAGLRIESNNNTIDGNIISSNNDHAVYIYSSSNNIVSNNSIISNAGRGINLDSSSYTNIFNNSIILNDWDAVYLYQSFCNNIVGNTMLSNHDDGVRLVSSNNNNITHNNVSSNGAYGIRSLMSLGNNISNNDISSNYNKGIYLYQSSNVDMISNNISSNNYGIYLDLSLNTNISSNDFLNNGIVIAGTKLPQYNSHNITDNNKVNGKPLYYYKNSDGVTIDGIQTGQLIIANCTNFTVKNLQIIKTDIGILVAFSKNMMISDNNISSNNLDGLHLYAISNCDLIDNTALYCKAGGIGILSSSKNNIMGNNASMNNGHGIDVWYSSKNTLSGNVAVSNGGHGIHIWAISNYNIVIGNRFSANNQNGIDLWTTANNNLITSNYISSNNQNGIKLVSVTNFNLIKYNYITLNSQYGIYIDSIDYNTIYHNNFIDNSIQAYSENNVNFWNATYPTGGNYWSEYTGVDLYSTPTQDVPPPDGIGDSSYNDIDGGGGAKDYYPLMEPFKNYMILKQGWNLISIPLIQVDQNLTKVLEMIDSYYDAVQWYDSTDKNDPWKHHKVNKPFGNDLIKINETIGFWIHITQPGDTIFLYNGTQPTVNQTIPLHPGWNLVGYPSLKNQNRTVGLNNLTFDTHVDAIWTYNAATQKWEEIGSSDYFEIGKGYWIHAKTKCEWEVPL